jgi:electron transport complex protein RnfC
MRLFQNSNAFYGGIHPSDGSDKLLSSGFPIVNYKPEFVEISTEQSGGSLCELIVKKGDFVKAGQLIGTPKNFLAVPLHASISGTVKEIKTYKEPHKNSDITALVIQNDGQPETNDNYTYSTKLMDISDFSKEMLISKMKEGGLTGMGGAGFPTHVKYETKNPIHVILINAAECEPYLTCDHRLMLQYGMELINGTNLLMKAANAKKVIICFEDNKEEAAIHLKTLLSSLSIPIEIKLLPTRYPQGGERQLIQAVTGMEVPIGGLPADVGVIVNNVATAKAFADIIFASKPLTSRIITITGNVKNPSNYLVPLGTKFSELISQSGGFTTKKNKVILGGPMTGTCIGVDVSPDELEGTVTKTSAGIVILDNDYIVETPCIRCGACARVCPAGINPFKIDNAYLNEDLALCENLFCTECIGCGSCSYVCPAKRELARRNVSARNEVKQLIRERQVK